MAGGAAWGGDEEGRTGSPCAAGASSSPSAPFERPVPTWVLRALFESPAIGAAAFDGAGRLQQANDRFRSLVGRSREDLAGRHLEELTHPDDVGEDRRQVARLVAGETDRIVREKRYLRPDGSSAWSLTSVSSIHGADGIAGGVMVIAQDAPAQRAAVEALAESEGRYRTLVEASPVATCVVREGRLEYLNPAAMSVMGATRAEQIVGRSPLEFVAPELHERLRERMEQAAAGRAPGPMEYRVTRLDGAPRIVETDGAPFLDARGLAYHAVIRDVTDDRKVREQAQISSRLAALGTLVKGVVHEINNPLAGAMAGQALAVDRLRSLRARVSREQAPGAEAMLHELDDVLDDLFDAQAGAQRISRIVKDLFAFGRSGERRTPVRVADVVADALRWTPSVVGTGRHVDVDCRAVPEVLAAPGQLRQVVLHLLSNAARAFPLDRPGRVRVTVGPGTPGRVRLEVADDGPGIAPEVMERIFDPFFTTRDVGQGVGLGLSVCHAIVTDHGGTIQVTSVPGEGTTFRVELPEAPPEP